MTEDKRQQLGIKPIYKGLPGYCSKCGHPDIIRDGICRQCYEKKG